MTAAGRNVGIFGLPTAKAGQCSSRAIRARRTDGSGRDLREADHGFVIGESPRNKLIHRANCTDGSVRART